MGDGPDTGYQSWNNEPEEVTVQLELPLPYDLTEDELRITDRTDNNLHRELDWLAKEVETDVEAERIFRSTILLYHYLKGTSPFASCLEQAIIWERG